MAETNPGDVAMHMGDVMRKLFVHHMRGLSFPADETDLTRAQMATLSQIGRAGRATMGSLAEDLSVAPGTLTGVVDRLIEKGLVERERNPEDRRKVMVGLTGEGEKVFARQQEGAARFSDMLFRLLTPDESRTLLQLMEKLVGGLEQAAHGHGG